MKISATLLLLSTTALVSLASVSGAHAEESRWAGTNGTQFDRPPNWTNGFEGKDLVIDGNDVAGDVVVFAPNTVVTVTIDSQSGSNPNSLVVQGGARLEAESSDSLVLGLTDGATSNITITGDGTKLHTTNGDVLIGSGNGAIGVLTVSAGATYDADSLVRVGFGEGAQGTITFDASTFKSTGEFQVGSAQTGAVTGTANFNNGSTATLDGGTSIGTKSSNTGTLNVSSGSSLTANGSFIAGVYEGSTGTVMVSGTNSTATLKDKIYFGYQGTGKLEVKEGGAVTATKTVYVGHDTNASGTLTVDGQNSVLTTQSGADIILGEKGTASMTVSDQATANVDGTLSVGSGVFVADPGGDVSTNSDATGDLTVKSNGVLNVKTGLYVGDHATGTLTLASGGSVNVNNGTGTLDIARSSGSTGTLIIGAASGSEAAAAGTLNAANVAFGSALGDSETSTGKIVFNITDTDYTFAANITGAGAVEQYAGTVKLTGTSSYTGATTIHGGTLDVGGTVASSAVSVQGDSAAATLILHDGSTLNVNSGGGTGTGTVDIAKSAGSTGTLIIGAAAGSDAVAAGTLNAATVAFGSGLTGSETSTGKIVFNITNTDYTFASNITGAGSVDIEAGTVNLTGTSSTYTGATTVNGGTLNIAGSIASVVSINNGAFLTGKGTIGGLSVNSGGTVSPGGNTIETLNVSGNTTFKSGSVYVVQVDDTSSDSIAITGGATIENNATVKLSALNGDNSSIAVDKKYTIVSTTTGVTGEFNRISKYSAYLQDEMTYEDNKVYLTRTRNGQALAVQTTTPNEGATAGAVDSLSNGNALYDAVVQLQSGQTSAAFDQLSGEVHASTASTIVTNAGMSRAAVNNRIRDSFSGGGTNSAPLVASNDDNMDGLLGKEKTTQVWMSNFGSWSTTSGGSQAHDTTTRGGGFMIGADTKVLDDWRFGVATGFGRDSIQDKNVSSSAMVDSYYLAAYGGTEIQATSLRFGALHAFQKIDAKRSVAFAGFTDNLTSDYDAQTTQLFAEGALRIKHQESRFEPYLNVAVVHSKVDGFQEKGGAAALTSSSQTDNRLFSTLGLRYGHDLAIDSWGLSGQLTAGLGWRHAYGDMSQDATLSFNGSNSFTVSSAADSRDSAVLEAGVGVDIAQDTTVSLNYNGDFSKETRENTLSAKLAVKF
ncbi:autotransporter domain-containing protein [Thalassospira sp. TSL5-1]|uniref:autotransporter outer membrane beta-barrel domain-containing protein n=2 Tax=Thalassospira sp. TSL5-1 TaxID=1544451 RepID=UPI0009388A3D|nr:autotransporter domain-containing protein [Thalassospira sp. TSL5-1]OKH87554.1 hypothetical protein LF95_12310 [Thalassospira sp. TSL5-1]